jgi:transcriptional regulator
VPPREQDKNRLELLQGTLDMLILQTLRWGAQHGYGIAQALRSGSEDVLQVETGSLYPALHRLEKGGWIRSEWRTSEHNQRAKYYQLTASGKKHLAAEHSRWKQLTVAIGKLMNRQTGENET